MNELISVIIPAFNVGLFLKRCLNSILNQTYSNIEILLIDDGSTDNTSDISDQYQSRFPEIIHVIHTCNQGVTKARFEGVLAAKGEWIGFVDGDDEIEPDMYERLYNNAIKYYADISHCGYKIIVNEGERVHEFYNTGRIVKQERLEGLRDLLDGPIEPSLCNKLYRKSFVQNLIYSGKMDTSIRFNEDLLMNYYLFDAANVSIFEDFCGYHYMARNTSTSRSSFRIEKVSDPVRVRRIILDYIEPGMKDIAWRNYLMICTIAFADLSLQKEYQYKASEYKQVLLSNKSKWRFLKGHQLLKLVLLMISPKLYKVVYRLYEKSIQSRKYE